MIDHYEKQVYYAEEKNSFLTVKWNAEAKKRDFVVVGVIFKSGEIIIQPYRGQQNLGVVCELGKYQMPGSTRNKEAIRAYFD